MKKVLIVYRGMKTFLFFVVMILCPHVLCVSQGYANLVTVQKVSIEFIVVAVLVLGGEALLVTWIFRRRGFNRIYFGATLFIVNIITWVTFFNVYRSVIENIYLVEGGIVILECIAIFYISRIPFIRSMSDKPVGILGAAGSSVIGNLFSWGLGLLILYLVMYFRRI